MSGTALAIVVMMVLGLMGLVKYWRQAVAVVLATVATVFCVGVYYLISLFDAGSASWPGW